MTNINQEFAVEIVRFNAAGESDVIAKNLAASITSWEREFNEEDEPEEDHGFLVPDEEDAADEEEDEEDGDEDEAEEGEEGEESDGTLYVTATLNKDVLSDIKTLQHLDDPRPIKISFVYGNDEVGTLRREFEVDSEMFISFSSGAKEETDLIIGLTFDVYSSELVF